MPFLRYSYLHYCTCVTTPRTKCMVLGLLIQPLLISPKADTCILYTEVVQCMPQLQTLYCMSTKVKQQNDLAATKLVTSDKLWNHVKSDQCLLTFWKSSSDYHLWFEDCCNAVMINFGCCLI